jgi:hypothetical protein
MEVSIEYLTFALPSQLSYVVLYLALKTTLNKYGRLDSV